LEGWDLRRTPGTNYDCDFVVGEGGPDALATGKLCLCETRRGGIVRV
jgi:hypothetical protein